jgi:hypothetical protein
MGALLFGAPRGAAGRQGGHTGPPLQIAVELPRPYGNFTRRSSATAAAAVPGKRRLTSR